MCCKLTCALLAPLLALAMLAVARTTCAEDAKQANKAGAAVMIEIHKKGKFVYIRQGDTEQKPVEVVVGQSVVWKNQTPAKHTATCDKKGPDGKPLFDTGAIQKKGGKGDAVTVLFDEKLFKAAG